MNSLKSFVVFMTMMISMMVRQALELTIINAYLGGHGDAILYWIGGVLMLGIFFVTFPQMWKARKSLPAPLTANTNKREFLLWISSLGFIVLPLLHTQKLVQVLSALQIPMSLKSLFLVVTLINLVFACAWAADNFRQWKLAPKKVIGVKEQANG